ncbi:MAG: hypothetical protein GY739_21785 [Mesoflavibacter sp.]|nr:hypothetical protein [Mesoflavibacter sp.]
MTAVLSQIDLDKNRFIGYDGNYATDGARAKGILKFNQAAGKMCTLVRTGTALLELAEAVTVVGAELKTDSDGKGALAVAGDYVAAIALYTGGVGSTIEVEIVKYKI